MKIEAIAAQGVLRFRDRVDLSLRDLPPGLIAFVGRNGEGKTTLLEAPIATFFRQLPSRPEKTLIDYVERADGYLDVTFELEGQGLYRARLNLDGPHRAADAVLTRTLPDGTTVYLNDGKLTTYDAAIAQLLPPQALMLASVFAAQNKNGAFSKLDRKGKGALFSSLLGLDQLAEWSARAKSAAGLVEQAIDQTVAARDAIARVLPTIDYEEIEAAQLQRELAEQTDRRRNLEHLIRNHEQRLEFVADAAQRHAVAVTRQTQIATEMHAKADAHQKNREMVLQVEAQYGRDREAAIRDLTARLEAMDKERDDTSVLTRELHRAAETLKAVIADADSRIANNKELIAGGATVRAAVEEVARLDKALATIRQSQQDTADATSQLLTRERELQGVIHQIEIAERELAQALKAIDVPCGAAGEYAACQFLVDAAAIQDRIPGLQAIAEGKPETLDALQTVALRLVDAKITAAHQRGVIEELEGSRVIAQKLAARHADLVKAEEKIAHHEKRKEDAKAAHATAQVEAQAREQKRLDDLAARRAERSAEHETDLRQLASRKVHRLKELHDDAQLLSEQIAMLKSEGVQIAVTVGETSDASREATEVQALLAVARREWDACTAALSRIEAERNELDRRAAEIGRAQQALADLDARLSTLRADLVDYQTLAKVLGRDGLPVLEIDAAGPTVSALANDLLQACYGNRFAVELVTQVERASKSKGGETHKDAFEIHVYDQERGGDARDLGDLSGGEQVIVDECVRSAIALVVNQRSPIPLRTLWRDECTGALDVDNGPRYIAMLRRLQELGGYHHVLTIIHNPEWAALADVQVHFAGGQVRVELPPFASQEAA